MLTSGGMRCSLFLPFTSKEGIWEELNLFVGKDLFNYLVVFSTEILRRSSPMRQKWSRTSWKSSRTWPAEEMRS